jgi:hypothetical protein
MTSDSADREGLFLAPSEADAAEQRPPAADHSTAGMDRLRHPFEADLVDVLEQQRTVVFDDEDYRR